MCFGVALRKARSKSETVIALCLLSNPLFLITEEVGFYCIYNASGGFRGAARGPPGAWNDCIPLALSTHLPF